MRTSSHGDQHASSTTPSLFHGVLQAARHLLSPRLDHGHRHPSLPHASYAPQSFRHQRLILRATAHQSSRTTTGKTYTQRWTNRFRTTGRHGVSSARHSLKNRAKSKNRMQQQETLKSTSFPQSFHLTATKDNELLMEATMPTRNIHRHTRATKRTQAATRGVV